MNQYATPAQAAEARHLLQVYPQLAIEPTGSDGVYLHCGDRRVLDLYGGHAVAALGYKHPELLAAMDSQAKTLFFQSNAVALDVRARAADALIDFAPDNLERVFFANSGAEANENALRLACRLTGRTRVVAIEHGFHGRTAGAAAVTWGAAGGWYGFPRLPFDVDYIPRDVSARWQTKSRARPPPSLSNWCRAWPAPTTLIPPSSRQLPTPAGPRALC